MQVNRYAFVLIMAGAEAVTLAEPVLISCRPLGIELQLVVNQPERVVFFQVNGCGLRRRCRTLNADIRLLIADDRQRRPVSSLEVADVAGEVVAGFGCRREDDGEPVPIIHERQLFAAPRREPV